LCEDQNIFISVSIYKQFYQKYKSCLPFFKRKAAFVKELGSTYSKGGQDLYKSRAAFKKCCPAFGVKVPGK